MGFFNPFQGFQKLSQHASRLIADERKNKTLENLQIIKMEILKTIKFKDSVNLNR